MMHSDRLRPTGVAAVFARDPTAACNCVGDHRVTEFGSITAVMKPLSHRVFVVDRVERGLSNLVVSLEPEGATGRFAPAAAPASVSQRQTISGACHTAKVVFLAVLSRDKAKF